MSNHSIEQLQDMIERQQRQLQLMLAVDDIRDSLPEPADMMQALASALAEHLRADLCLICLYDSETGELHSKAVKDRSGCFGQFDRERVQELEVRAQGLFAVNIWEGDAVPSALAGKTCAEQVTVAAVPIFLKEQRLGVLLVARLHAAFDQHDIELLTIAESLLDSAVIQAYEYNALQLRNKELETVYRIDNIRDQHLPFDQMLNAVLAELRKVIKAEAGFIMLYNQAERLLELRATTNNDLFPIAPHYEELNRIATRSLQQAKMVCENRTDTALHSVMCLPLILEHRIIGVLGVINRYGQNGFDAEDRRLLSAIASQMDTAIFESLEQRHLREILGRSLDPHIMERLLSSQDQDIVNCDRSIVTVLYADVRGSTALAERIAPDLLLGFINDYLGRMTDVIFAHEGTLDKFVGDEVMALFNAPFSQKDHALRAIRAALDMQKIHQTVMENWEPQGVPKSPIGIGIATGELIVGEVGCRKRTDYTVIGRAANLGARLCSVAQGGEIIICQQTYDLVKEFVEAKPIVGVKLKGVPDGIIVYQAIRIIADAPS
ncbi:adenylate/guanylate cyclase with GAF sensor(S) [Candidatus Moduliflexus flocculans]|uniref:Adenylate/guanylate cyclase with GAF sensor(S) n=1 Tax=Candidatus Moduliflexus flocculans TaxID=1499966 RepID=A0A0S6VQQ2_9BACT|nr:adenylate/guanylate cyclase with GAF sensor(S) [Candidatus Moduliflexus flocculans]